MRTSPMLKIVAYAEVDRLRTLYDFYATPTNLSDEPDHWYAALHARALAYVWRVLGKDELSQLHHRLADLHASCYRLEVAPCGVGVRARTALEEFVF